MKRAKHSSCSVVGCTEQHVSLHRLPASGDRRAEWMDFIFDRSPPATTVGGKLLVCAHHFLPHCFTNLGQYNAGLSARLCLEEGSVPTLRRRTAGEGHLSTSGQLAGVQHVACQTDPPPKMCTVGTQLSAKTLRPHFKSIGVQKTVSCTDVGVGTSKVAPQRLCSSAPMKRPHKRPRLELKEEVEDPLECSSSANIADPLCSSNDPTGSVTESVDVIMESSTPVHKTPTYIVYENCLLQLFEVCPMCTQASDVRTRRLGTFLSVEQKCPHCQFSRRWNSQPVLGSTPAGNLQLSAAVYATGASFSKVENIFRAMQLKMFQYDTFRRHARMYIEPAIVHRWKTRQAAMLEQLSQQQNVVLGGDLRANLTGYSAKFGNYATMDLRSNTVIDLQLVQSNEVGGSCHMEKEGLKRTLALLESRGVTFHSIVTQPRPQIHQFLKQANITHYYDVGHMEKGLSKKLLTISQSKDCEELKKWLRSIKNHMYWTAASSTSGPERVAKWTSILNHVQDIHTHEDPVFPRCLHPQRTSRDQSKWLRAGTPAFYRLEKVLTNKRLLQDVAKLSPHHQAWSLEAFRSVALRFAPKNVLFPFLGMLCRLYLAALHFNENAGHPQATASAGEPLSTVDLPEHQKGECTVKPVKAEATFYYVDELLDLIFGKVFQDPAPYVDEVLKIAVPEDLRAQFERPDRPEAMANYNPSGFGHTAYQVQA